MVLHQRTDYCTNRQYPTKPTLPQGIAPRCTLMATQRERGGAGPTCRRPMPQALSQTRIIKKLAPGEAGTKRLSQRYGTDLVCVRYRQDREARRRYTTVEIVVDSGPLHQTALLRAGQLVRIGLNESELRKTVVKLGAIWDPTQRAWRMSQEAVRKLQLEHRVLTKK